MKTRLATIWLVLVFAFTAAAKNSFQLVEVTHDVDSGTGLMREFEAHYSYERGNLVRVVRDRDLNADGTNDYHSVVTYTYNRRGLRIAAASETVSSLDPRLDGRSRVTYQYDHQGNTVGTLSEIDSDLDGTTDHLTRVTLAYDDHGNIIRRVVELDREADGIWENVTTYTRTYDAQGNLLTELRETDGDGNGSIDYIVRKSNTLDSAGNAVLSVTEIDYEADGIIDGTERRTATYNSRGDVLSSRGESFDAEGISQGVSEIHYSYVYDSHGNRTRVTALHDFDADGTIDVTEITNYTYARVKGGRANRDDK